MGVADSYNVYINRLKSKRGENVYYQQAAQNITRSLTSPFTEMNRKIGIANRRNDVALSGQIEQTRAAVNDYNSMAYGAYSEAGLQDIARRDQIDSQLFDLEFQRNQAVEAERKAAEERRKAEKAAKRNAIFQMIGTVGGAALGAIVGGPAGMAAGASLGGGLVGGIGNLTSSSPDYGALANQLGGAISGAAGLYGQVQIQNQGKAIAGQVQELKKFYGDDTDKFREAFKELRETIAFDGMTGLNTSADFVKGIVGTGSAVGAALSGSSSGYVPNPKLPTGNLGANFENVVNINNAVNNAMNDKSIEPSNSQAFYDGLIKAGYENVPSFGSEAWKRYIRQFGVR